MLQLRRPPRSLALFLTFLVALGTALQHPIDALGAALFVYFISSIDGKPAWKFIFGAPGDVDSGRACGRFHSWQRVGATSPEELRRLPPVRSFR